MKTIFISYSRDDSTYADDITQILKDLKIDFFRDVKDIEWGKDVQNEVSAALDDCIAVLVVVSPGSLKSQWVPYEIGYATALRKRILPYITHTSLDLPAYISNLNYVTSIDEVRSIFQSAWTQQTLIRVSSYVDDKLEAKYLEWWEAENQKRNSEVVRFEGLNIFVDRTVFSPNLRMTYSSYFASEFLKDLSGKRVLDLGTGSGVLAIIAAKRKAKEVIAVDIDPAAVSNAKKNVRKFRLNKKIRVIRGDIFDIKDSLFENSKIKGKFDFIISNLPIAFSASAWSHLNADFSKNIFRWAHSLREHLADQGVAYLSWASFGDQELLAKAFSDAGLNVREFTARTFGITWQTFEVTVKDRIEED